MDRRTNCFPRVISLVHDSSGIFATLCVGADLYLIVKTRFHYTVDIVMSIVITLLIYTNAGALTHHLESVPTGKGSCQKRFAIPTCFNLGGLQHVLQAYAHQDMYH